eukprot:gene42990-30159_t
MYNNTQFCPAGGGAPLSPAPTSAFGQQQEEEQEEEEQQQQEECADNPPPSRILLSSRLTSVCAERHRAEAEALLERLAQAEEYGTTDADTLRAAAATYMVVMVMVMVVVVVMVMVVMVMVMVVVVVVVMVVMVMVVMVMVVMVMVVMVVMVMVVMRECAALRGMLSGDAGRWSCDMGGGKWEQYGADDMAKLEALYRAHLAGVEPQPIDLSFSPGEMVYRFYFDKMVQEQVADIREAFNLFDKNGDGTITKKELRSALRELGEQPTKKELQDFIKDVDKDGNGKIEYSEFFHFAGNLEQQ